MVEIRKKLSTQTSPISLKSPISMTSPTRLKATIQQQRTTITQQNLVCSQMEDELVRLREEIDTKSFAITPTLDKDLTDIFKGIIYIIFTIFIFNIYIPYNKNQNQTEIFLRFQNPIKKVFFIWKF